MLGEVWSKERGRGGISSVIIVVIVTIIIMIVSCSRCSQKGSSKGFHGSLNFIDYKGCAFDTFYDFVFKFLTVFHKFSD